MRSLTRSGWLAANIGGLPGLPGPSACAFSCWAGCLAPSGALAAASTADAEVTARVARLLTPQARLPLHVQALVCCTAALLVAEPITLLLHSF